jgi:O-antigen/teichoic acid export membrane protein
LPVLARHYSPRFVERSIVLLLSIGLPASLLISFRAEDVAQLVFGPKYLPSALPLRLVIWAVPILFSYVPLVTALFVHDRQRYVLFVLLANLALALALDALLIPPYGVLGASIATLIVEMGALIGYLLLAQRANLGVVWARGLLRPTLICVPLVVVLLVGQSLPFMFVLPAVILLWAALFGLLRPWAGWRLNLCSTDQSGQALNIPCLRRW